MSNDAISGIRFNFKGATFQQVIEFFSRVTNLPVIWETPAPEGTLDYLSDKSYAVPEALRILNIILQSKGVMLRVSDSHLHMQKLDQMQKEDIPTFIGKIPAEVTADQIVTVVYPLNISLAKPLAEKLATMVASYGSVAAIEQSNALMITETAANARRILMIVEQLDKEDPEGAVEIFALKNAKATELMVPLKALMSTKVEKFVINQQGQQVKIEEDQMPGLAISADERTNSIIAKGVQNKIDKLREAIGLLDVPAADGAQGRAMRSLSLVRLSPADAAGKLNQLYQKIEEKTRPIVLTQDDALKVTVIGDEAAVNEGAALIRELDGGGAGSGEEEPVLVAIPLQRTNPTLVITAIQSLLNRRQQASTKLVAGPDNRSVIVSGLPSDVESIKALMPLLDRQVSVDRSIRVLTIQNAEAGQIAANLEALFSTPDQLEQRPIIRIDGPSNSLLVRATDEQFKTIEQVVSAIDKATIASTRQMRMIAVDPSKGSAEELARMLQRLLGRSDGSQSKVEVISLEELIKRGGGKPADRPPAPAVPSPSSSSSSLGSNDAIGRGHRLAAPIMSVVLGLLQASGHESEPEVTIAVDPATNSLIIVGPSRAIDRLTALARQIQDQIPAIPGTVRYITLPESINVQNMANLIGQTLDRITPAGGQMGDVRRRVGLIPDPAGNALLVAANDNDFQVVADLIAALSKPVKTDFPIRTITLQRAEASAVAKGIQQFYTDRSKLIRRSPGSPGGDPGPAVAILGIDSSNTLLISASDEDFKQVENLVTQFDTAEASAGLTFRVFQLRHAKATEIERTVQSLVNDLTYNQGESMYMFYYWMPQQQQSKKRDTIAVRADARLNSLIVTGRGDKFTVVEKLIEILDAAPPEGERRMVRLYRINYAQLQTVTDVIREAFNQSRQRRWWEPPDPTEIKIQSDAATNMLIVSATGREHEEIKALVAGIEAQFAEAGGGAGMGLSVRVLKVATAPAARIASALTEAFQAKARQSNQPLSIRVDPHGNNLIIASNGAIFDEIKASADQLDAMAPAPGQSIFIIDLENIPPETAKTVIETIGLDKPQPADSGSRIVSEPVKVSLLPGAGRNAIVVVGSPADRETIVGLLKAIDSAPELAEAQTRIIRLKHAQAGAVAQVLNQLLRPAEQQSETPLARALKEQVRRLSVQGPPEADGAAAGGIRLSLDLTKPVRIIPDAALNALIISSTYENIAALEELTALLDQLPITDTVTVQLFPLQNISADQFSRIVKDIFSQGKQLGRTTITKVAGVPEGAVGKALLDELALSIDERTNTVIVAGTEQSVALVEVLCKRIDSDVAAGWVEPRVVPLRYADANELAQTLNSIVVEGSSNLPQSSPLQRQIGRLRMARLQQNGGKVLESDVFQPMTKLVIRGEPQMNALILVGTPANIEIVSELVAMLDVESASPANAVRIYPVENASATRLAQTIRQLFDQQIQSRALRPEDRVIINADERTNALVVATSPRSFAVLESMLKTLDSKLAPELREIRTIDVKNASSTRLASVIQQMMDARLERLRRVQPETADLERAMIVADGRTNSLVVAAGNDTFEVIKRLAADLDTDTLGDASLIQVLPMAKGNIDRVASAINQIMNRRYADLPPELRNSQRPLVLTDPRSNSLLVAANPEDLASIQDLVNKIGATPENPAVGIHVISLGPNVRAEIMAPRLQRLMSDRLQSMGPSASPSDRVTIEADLASNSLIVAASQENLDAVKGLIEALTQADTATAGAGVKREVELVSLGAASRASDVVEMLNDLYVDEANRTRGQNTVRVTADERLNAVLISAPASDIAALKNLIAQLEGARPASVIEVKYVPLQSANALETVSLIENVLRGRGISGRANPRQATVLKYLREIVRAEGDEAATQPDDQSAPVEMEVSAAIRESITLTPDLRTNTIIVSAPKQSIRMIEQMIRDLDASSTGSKSIRIFKLVNADALAMAQIITDLFNLKQGSNFYVLKPREDQPMPISTAPGALAPGTAAPAPSLDGGGVSGTELTAVPDERQQLSITVDSRTNSLIVSGTPTYLDLVSQVVEELDKLEANEREVYVYQLRNAVADEVAKVVGDFVDQEQRKLISTLSVDQLGSAARLLEREITIRGDVKSNTVLVSASPRYMDQVKDMIRKLDVDPPQVLIQVMLAEVTLDSRDEWGVDMEFRADVDGTDITAGFGLASAFVTGLGVPNLAIASSDFDLLIRAMKSQGRLQVLSNPSIMAANNAPARIQVGETIRLPEAIAFDVGSQQTAVVPEDIGVILTVTPSINPDGFVRMDINPEISSLSARTTQISEDFQSPIITRRRADTTVTVHDGQTIVLGGLISDRYERRDRMVPFFGELPIIGPLFRSNTEETAKTELLIVLTPHVIESPADFGRVDSLTGFEIDRLSLPQEIKDQIRKSLIDGTGGIYDAQGNRIDVKVDQKDDAKSEEEDQE
ncbi:MAG: hypothetical protein L0Y44_09480 [Phycisphaerales bacterium]|nr:hypothetical protein [Phycisphaerales bacterium]MCI0675258.1 hypothetical protein [Phycisphaerales bacterium]